MTSGECPLNSSINTPASVFIRQQSEESAEMRDWVFRMINLAVALAIIVCYVALPWEAVFGEYYGYAFLLAIAIEIVVFGFLRTYLERKGRLTRRI